MKAKMIHVFARDYSYKSPEPVEIFHLAEVGKSYSVTMLCGAKLAYTATTKWRRCLKQDDPTVDSFAEMEPVENLCKNCVRLYMQWRLA